MVRVSSNPHLRSKKFSSPGKLWKQGLDALLRETREKSILLKSLGFNVNLAPVADVSTNPRDFIYDRTTGMDAEETADYTARVTEAQSFYGLGSVLKHFPGYGNNKDTHTGVAVDERSMETFLEQDFLPFQAGIAVEETVWPSGELRRRLIGGDGLDKLVGGLSLGVPAKEEIAPQVIGHHVLHGVFRRNPDEKELAHFLLQGHALQKGQQGGLLGVLRGFRLLFRRGLRGLRRGEVRLLRRRGHHLPAAAGEEKEEEQGGE